MFELEQTETFEKHIFVANRAKRKPPCLTYWKFGRNESKRKFPGKQIFTANLKEKKTKNYTRHHRKQKCNDKQTRKKIYKHTKQNKTGTDVTEHNCENRKYSSSD